MLPSLDAEPVCKRVRRIIQYGPFNPITGRDIDSFCGHRLIERDQTLIFESLVQIVAKFNMLLMQHVCCILAIRRL